MKKKKNAAAPDAESLLQLLGAHPRPLRLDGILALSGQPHGARKKVEKLLRQLQENGQISQLPGGFWGPGQESVIVTGEYVGSASGSGRVKVSQPADYPHREIHISPFQAGNAWHRDLVRALILPGSSGARGKILEVVERRLKEVPAVFSGHQKKSLLFKPADSRVSASFRVAAPGPLAAGLKPGDVAVLRPLRAISDTKWQAEIIRIEGPLDRISAQESIVKLNQQVPGPFPALALEQAAALPPAPTAQDMEGREDWRALPFVTIDGADARDFDDAIHVEKTGSGWILRVAIADVSHYVRPDSRKGSLDAEALARGNSWYFPRSVEPMLPKALSNGLCSLKPNEDRLAMLVEMPFDHRGNPGKPRFAQIAMRSAGRLVYDDVAAFFNGENDSIASPDIASMLREGRQLYKALARARRERGTLDFFLPDPVYKFDEEGKLEAIGERQRNDAHMLIEEFMIAANEAVAGWLEEQKQDFLYRVHPGPEPEKLARLYDTLHHIAPECLPPDGKANTEPGPGAIRKILGLAVNTPQEYVVNRLCLRSMAQARYQPQNIGHFGLASKSYCHFTSPIRRYADLLTHRALKKQLGVEKHSCPDKEQLLAIAGELNGLERRAVECEREIAKRLACVYLEGREGETFKGVISGVADFGLFVEFDEIPAEGLIRVEELGRDWYHFDAPAQALRGASGGQVWQLGQPVEARLLSVDLEKQELRLAPARLRKQARKKSGSWRKTGQRDENSGSRRPHKRASASFRSRRKA
ncbi:MAG: ribonuclease R [Desulfovibrio sp.]|nr:ribonuclease R [Desulfovibrio sp.]